MNKETKNKEKIKKELEEKIKIIDEYTDHLKRLQADFENYIKRAEKEKQELINYATHKLILRLLDIVDDFEKALDVIKKSNDKEVVEGVEMIFKKLYSVLEGEGVMVIENNGRFDPYKHEAIDFAEGEDGVILEELQKGYMLSNVVIRPSKVKIGKGGKNG